MDGALLVDAAGAVDYWSAYFPHPASTWRTIFGKVWYEGYPEPTYTWQSSSGTDVFEPKYSLIPLIFGTVKATVYAMLFAVPGRPGRAGHPPQNRRRRGRRRPWC